MTGECEECRKDGLQQRRDASHDDSSGASHVAEATPRLGHNFGEVRVQADAGASEGGEQEEVKAPPVEEEPEAAQEAPEASSSKQQTPETPTTKVVKFQKTFSAFIRRAAKPHLSALGQQTTFGEASREPHEGETWRIADTLISPLAALEQTDAIASTFSYTSSIKQAGAAPPAGDFGITRPFFQMKLAGTQDATGFKLTCPVEGQITYQLASLGKTDISSDSDPDIFQSNYTKVVSDLTPNMSDLNGRPPRTQYWAEDLTKKHECFHAKEDVKFGGDGVVLADKWLNKQTASTEAEAIRKATQALDIVRSKVDTEMVVPASEKRAYGDGAPLYRARADAIKAKGDAKKYPAAPPPKAASTAIPSTPVTKLWGGAWDLATKISPTLSTLAPTSAPSAPAPTPAPEAETEK